MLDINQLLNLNMMIDCSIIDKHTRISNMGYEYAYEYTLEFKYDENKKEVITVDKDTLLTLVTSDKINILNYRYDSDFKLRHREHHTKTTAKRLVQIKQKIVADYNLYNKMYNKGHFTKVTRAVNTSKTNLVEIKFNLEGKENLLAGLILEETSHPFRYKVQVVMENNLVDIFVLDAYFNNGRLSDSCSFGKLVIERMEKLVSRLAK